MNTYVDLLKILCKCYFAKLLHGRDINSCGDLWKSVKKYYTYANEIFQQLLSQNKLIKIQNPHLKDIFVLLLVKHFTLSGTKKQYKVKLVSLDHA